MKSKTPHAFWLRWIGVSAIHAVLFTAFWMVNPSLFNAWYSFFPLTLMAGVGLISLQYWAMPQMMRPGAKSWFSAGVLGQILASSLHSLLFLRFVTDNSLAYMTALFLPLAIIQSIALSKQFKKAWLFGIAMMLPIVLYTGLIEISDSYQIFFREIVFWLFRASLLGASLNYLQKYQQKESSNYSASSERLELQNERNNEQNESTENEQGMAFASRTNEL